MAKSRSPPFSRRAGILRVLLRQVLELGAALDLRDQRLASSSFSTRMWRARYSVPLGLGLELVVLGLDLGVGDRVLLLDSPRTARGSGCSGAPAPSAACSRRVAARPRFSASCTKISSQHDLCRATRASSSGGSCWPRAACAWLGNQRVDARLRHGLAVDDGDVLRLGGQRRRARHTAMQPVHERAARRCFFMRRGPFRADGVRVPADASAGTSSAARRGDSGLVGRAGVDGEGVDAPRDQRVQGIIHEAMSRHAASDR